MNHGGIQAGTALALKGRKTTCHLEVRVFPVTSAPLNGAIKSLERLGSFDRLDQFFVKGHFSIPRGSFRMEAI
jgi:hypothetical protein